MIEIFIFFLSGILIGIAAGLFGLGGGLIIVPVVTYSLNLFSKVPFNEAILIGITTSLASMVVTGAMATYVHTKNNNISYEIIKKFFVGIIFGSLLIGLSIKNIPGDSLKNFFVIYTFFVGYRIFKHQPDISKSIIPNKLISNLIGFFFSIISGLVGIGGGTLFIPFLIKKNISSKLAIGTSSALGFLIGLGASIGILISSLFSNSINQSIFGYIYLPAIIFLTLPSLIFVKLSANWLLSISDRLINKLFSILLFMIGFTMLIN